MSRLKAGGAEPVGIGLGADEGEEVAHVAPAFLAGPRSRRHMDSKSTALALERGDLGAGNDRHVGQAFDPIDQILRHGVAQRPAGDQGHIGGMLGEENRGLPRRIAAADERDILAPAQVRFERRGPIMDGDAVELL